MQAAIDEALKLERAMSQLRTSKRVVVLHYAPIGDTIRGEAPVTYLGSSRLAEVIDRHGANMVLHGHAHHGSPDGKTTAGVAVHNVALTILQNQNPPAVFRVFCSKPPLASKVSHEPGNMRCRMEHLTA